MQSEIHPTRSLCITLTQIEHWESAERLATTDNPSEALAELLFNLGSVDRLTLLSQINGRKQKLASLSKTINASMPECTRHLARLREAGLVKRDSDGFYVTTTLGEAMLRLLPIQDFLLRHREYFLSHDLSRLPSSFVVRLGELAKSNYVERFGRVLDRVRETIFEVTEFACVIADDPIIVGRSLGKGLQTKDVRARFILPTGISPDILRAIKTPFPRAELATLKDVRLALGLNEKAAGVIFPTLEGKIDFGAGFFGDDPTFREWCNDLFEYYWKRSTKAILF
jgi:predicted transcriptional regulator